MSGAVTSDEAVARALDEKLKAEEDRRVEEDWKLAQVMHENTTGTTATDFNCSMCFEDFKGMQDLNKGVVTTCGHKFCMECFLKYVGTREKDIEAQIQKARNVDKVEKDIKCPLCRASVLKDANRMRRMHGMHPVYIPNHAMPTPKQMTWDPATSVVVVCNSCNQRLFAPPGKVVKCVCRNLIQPQEGSNLWRSDHQVMARSNLPPEQRTMTLVICPGCRRNFTARAGETVRCQCGTGLYVPTQQQQQQQQQQRHHR